MESKQTPVTMRKLFINSRDNADREFRPKAVEADILDTEHYGHKFFVNENPESYTLTMYTWVVSEYSTGGMVAHGETRDKAIDFLKRFVLTLTENEFLRPIKEAQNKHGIINY